MGEGVAPQDVEIHGHRAEAVGGVEVAVAVEVVLQPPAVFVVGRVEHHDAQVVQVGALGMGEAAKDAFLDHLHDPQLLAVVAAVFQHDAVALGLLGNLHQVNAFLVGRGDGYLTGRVEALAHGISRHRGVPFPRCADQSEVRGFGAAGFFPSSVAASEDARGIRLEFGDALQGLLDLLRVDVADGRDFGVALADEPLEHIDEARAPIAKADEGHPDLGEGFGLKVKDGTLQPGLGHTLLEKGVEVFVGGLSLQSAGGHESAQAEESAPQKFPSLHGLKLPIELQMPFCGEEDRSTRRKLGSIQ